ncbi:hypothetical protein Sjap_017983 [Stephania japonica]|uniref:Uncharacterized protein n=1 Tax=Stephania japonica TaxID=461633 RepID=A0AAP0I7C2_9MAGN
MPHHHSSNVSTNQLSPRGQAKLLFSSSCSIFLGMRAGAVSQMFSDSCELPSRVPPRHMSHSQPLTACHRLHSPLITFCHVSAVEVCGICRDNTHPTDVCPYEPEYESYPYWEYSSINQRFHQDILQYQENMEQLFKDINSNFQSTETLTSKMNDTPNRSLEEEEFPVLLSCDEKETLNDATLKSVETNEHAMNEYFAIDGLTPCIYEYWSDHEESEGETEVSQSESEIVMAQTYEEEVKKEIEVTLTRPEELQQESKDNQSFVLVNPFTLPYIFDDFDIEVDETERSKPFCTADTFVLDDLDITDSYVLKVPDKLPFLNKGVSISLPNARGESIILRYSLLEGIT